MRSVTPYRFASSPMRVKPSPASDEPVPTSLPEAASLSAVIIFIIFSVFPGSGAHDDSARRKPWGSSFPSWFQHAKSRPQPRSYVYVNHIDPRPRDRKGLRLTKCRSFFTIRCGLVTLVNALFTTFGELCAGRSPVSILYRIVHGFRTGVMSPRKKPSAGAISQSTVRSGREYWSKPAHRQDNRQRAFR